MDAHTIRQRLSSAALRLTELLALIRGGDLGGTAADDRDRLTMEFFFHTVGAIEFLAQFINERLNLSLDRVTTL